MKFKIMYYPLLDINNEHIIMNSICKERLIAIFYNFDIFTTVNKCVGFINLHFLMKE